MARDELTGDGAIESRRLTPVKKLVDHLPKIPKYDAFPIT
jgi:hypothetical protein